ncbi:33671_t:CDS:2, partial [Gigaspora margarita]
FLKDYDLIPRHLRKLGAVYGAVVHESQNPAHFTSTKLRCGKLSQAWANS